MPISAGQDIESICNKCGDVWHVVVAMVGDKVAKVQCKECSGLHRYRPPGGTSTKAAAATRRKNGGASKGKSKQAAPPAPQVEPDPSKPIRPYAVRDTFEVRERIDHPKFGVGVVEQSSPGKIEVFFPVGRKVLAQAKPGSALERPPRFNHDE